MLTPNFIVGSKIYILSKNIRTARPLHKLEDKFLGLFTVLAEVGIYVRKLNLLLFIKYNLIFSISLLKIEGDVRLRLKDYYQPVVRAKGI